MSTNELSDVTELGSPAALRPEMPAALRPEKLRSPGGSSNIVASSWLCELSRRVPSSCETLQHARASDMIDDRLLHDE